MSDLVRRPKILVLSCEGSNQCLVAAQFESGLSKALEISVKALTALQHLLHRLKAGFLVHATAQSVWYINGSEIQ